MTSERLSRFLSLYPKANDKVMEQLSKDFRNITDKDFRIAKDRIGLFKELASLLKKKPLKLDKQAYQQILGAALDGEVVQVREGLKGNNLVGSKQNYTRLSFNPTTWAPSIRSVWKAFSRENDDMDNLIRRATEAGTQISDSQFLSQLEQDVERHAGRIPQFGVWAGRAKHRAFEHLKVSIKRTVGNLLPTVRKMQEEECMERIKRENAKRADEELDGLGVDLINHVNDLSSQTSYSCVFGSFLLVDRDPRLTFVGIHCS